MTDTQYAVEYQEVGTGAAIVFVPGSFSAGSTWRAIAMPMTERYRTISTSLLGYGKTQERRLPGGSHMEDEVEVLETVLQRADAPVHLVAHSFGGWVALLLAIRNPSSLLSLTLLEPTVFNLLSQCGETSLSQEVFELVDQYTSEWSNGDKAAVRHIIDFYGGKGTFEGYPEPVKDKLASQTETNILDWKSGFASAASLSEISNIQVPTMIVCGSKSHMAMKRSNQLLSEHMPNSTLLMLEGANHFMIGTHAQELTTLIGEHVRTSQNRPLV